MRCVAVIDTHIPDPDTIILWDDGGQRLVAHAYKDGMLRKTRPLEAPTFEGAMAEIRDAYNINSGLMTRVTHWSPRLEPPFPPIPDRWQIA
jgi:hypothetical protein